MAENRTISIKAIVLGFLTDLAISTVIGFAVGMVTAILLMQQNVSQQEMEATFVGTRYLIFGAILGFGSTIVGGYVCGRVARNSELLNAALMGVLQIMLAITFSLISRTPTWYNVLSFVGVIPFATLGGYLALQRRKKHLANIVASA